MYELIAEDRQLELLTNKIKNQIFNVYVSEHTNYDKLRVMMIHEYMNQIKELPIESVQNTCERYFDSIQLHENEPVDHQ